MVDAGLFPEFAHHRVARIFAGVDAALRHLPFQAGKNDLRPVVPEAPADQDVTGGVEQRDPDIGAIGFCLSFRIINGYRMAKPTVSPVQLRSHFAPGMTQL